jgi:hypothetical protein
VRKWLFRLAPIVVPFVMRKMRNRRASGQGSA